MQSLDFALNLARPDQADVAFLEAVSDPQDEFESVLGMLVRRVSRGFRQTVERLPTVSLKTLPPLEEPGTRARDAFEDVSDGFPLFKELESQATVLNFLEIFFVHPARLKAG